jgi:hypothetical protein
MASGLYAKGREAFAKGLIDWESGADIRAVLVNVTGAGTTYTVNLATHQFLSSITAGARISVSSTMTGRTATDGICDADDTLFTSVAGDTVEAVVIYDHNGGSDGARRLIAYIDNYTGLTYTPSGANVTVIWPSSALTKIFKL